MRVKRRKGIAQASALPVHPAQFEQYFAVPKLPQPAESHFDGITVCIHRNEDRALSPRLGAPFDAAVRAMPGVVIDKLRRQRDIARGQRPWFIQFLATVSNHSTMALPAACEAPVETVDAVDSLPGHGRAGASDTNHAGIAVFSRRFSQAKAQDRKHGALKSATWRILATYCPT